MQNFAYIQPVTECHQLPLECINYGLSSLAVIGNFNSIGGTGCYVDHILNWQEFEGLDRLWLAWLLVWETTQCCVPDLLTRATQWLHHESARRYTVLLPLSVASPEDADQGVTGHWPARLYDVFRHPLVALIRNHSFRPISGMLPRMMHPC